LQGTLGLMQQNQGMTHRKKRILQGLNMEASPADPKTFTRLVILIKVFRLF
jgi:hypothetical protein